MLNVLHLDDKAMFNLSITITESIQIRFIIAYPKLINCLEECHWCPASHPCCTQQAQHDNHTKQDEVTTTSLMPLCYLLKKLTMNLHETGSNLYSL